MTSQITMPADAMKDIVAKAVLESITSDQRDVLIAAALEHLITPPPSTGYGSAKIPSPLQQAFHNAVAEASREVVREMVAGELNERIRSLIREKVVEALADDSLLASGIGFAVGEQVEKALRGDR